jgi:hypothetical protein
MPEKLSKLNEVKSIEYRERYVYRVSFDDGLSGDVDFTEYLDLGPVFSPSRDISHFRRARVEGGTISWPNGADIAPETLYERIEATADAETLLAHDKPSEPKDRQP